MENRDLLFELKKLGIRRQSPFSLLKRSNPLNKYIGKLSYKLKKRNHILTDTIPDVIPGLSGSLSVF
jgi:hypothetical protein